MAATSGERCFFTSSGIDRAVGARRHRLDAIAEQRGGRRIGAVRRLRHQHDRALLAARRERRLDRHHAAQLAMRAGLRRQRDRRHAGQLAQPARQLGDQRERARHGRLRLQRMDVAEAGQPRHLLVQARIVLHRARAERKHAGVDAVVHARQPHVVAHRLRLGEAGQADRSLRSRPPRRGVNAFGSSRSTPVTSVRPISKISASSMRSARLPVKVFGAVDSAVDGFGRTALPVHASTSFSACRIGGAVLVGVHLGRGDDDEIAQLGLVRRKPRRTARRRARPFAASFSITCARVARHPDGELVEERLVQHVHARHLAERVRERDRIGVIDAARAGAARPRRAA